MNPFEGRVTPDWVEAGGESWITYHGVNCAASRGEMRLWVSDKGRHAFDGFNYADCTPFTGDRVAQRGQWKGRTLDELKGQELRLEFYLKRRRKPCAPKTPYT